MKLPCEKALWTVLPQIRSDLAQELLKQGLSQKEVAEKLGLTPSAVSQYIHKKRAVKMNRTKAYKEMITAAALKILASESDSAVSKVICACCTKINR
ncbi:MAG: helix-turn-helix domain-containing protein [Candidatus Altiarchaeota archaeon]